MERWMEGCKVASAGGTEVWDGEESKETRDTAMGSYGKRATGAEEPCKESINFSKGERQRRPRGGAVTTVDKVRSLLALSS
jgi:hypothetical protein